MGGCARRQVKEMAIVEGSEREAQMLRHGERRGGRITAVEGRGMARREIACARRMPGYDAWTRGV